MFREPAIVESGTGDVVGPDAAPGWEAELQLGFARRGEKTLLTERHQRGPLTVQRPFYPEGGLCHVYLLHPPGGVVAGDRLQISARAGCGAEALLTTPAAGKFYRSGGRRAHQQVTLNVDKGAALEWLPQESIIYQGARLQSDVTVELADEGRFLAWDIAILGRPAAGEGFDDGEAELTWRIVRGGRPLYLETMRLDGEALAARWGLNGLPVCATLLASPVTEVQLNAVRELIGDAPWRAVTLIDDLLICRAGARHSEALRRFFEQVRALLRPHVVRRENHTPRIWAT